MRIRQNGSSPHTASRYPQSRNEPDTQQDPKPDEGHYSDGDTAYKWTKKAGPLSVATIPRKKRIIADRQKRADTQRTRYLNRARSSRLFSCLKVDDGGVVYLAIAVTALFDLCNPPLH